MTLFDPVVDSDSFLLRYPIFNGAVAIEVLDSMIEEAYEDLPESSWASSSIRNRACALIVAHRLQLERDNALRQGIVMTVMQEKTNLDYKSLMQDKSYWEKTSYGSEYLQVRKKAVSSSMFVV